MSCRTAPACATGLYVDDGALSFCGERKGGKNAAKTKVLESFPRLRCRLRRFLSATRLRHCANFLPCFRIASASPSATRSALVLADLTGAPSAYAVRRREGTPPYEYFEGWCHRADVGIGPYGTLSVNDSYGSASRTTRAGFALPLL